MITITCIKNKKQMYKILTYCVSSISGGRAFALIIVVLGILNTALTFAATPPDTLYGNYVGMGKCTAESPKPCTDTGAMDTIYLQRLNKVETDVERQAREGFGLEKNDTKVSIRILHDHGHSCTFEDEMYWAGDHLDYFQKGPYASKICKIQLWFKNDNFFIKDPGDACSELFCSGAGYQSKFEGRHYQKGSDPLFAAYKKSDTPPPTAIFGKYYGTGKCAEDERKSEYCNESKPTDYIVIKLGKTTGANVSLGRTKTDEDDYFCLRDADAVWQGDHLVYIKKMPETPGMPHFMQFWFKGDTVVVKNVFGKHCGTYIHGSYFKKLPVMPSGN